LGVRDSSTLRRRLAQVRVVNVLGVVLGAALAAWDEWFIGGWIALLSSVPLMRFRCPSCEQHFFWKWRPIGGMFFNPFAHRCVCCGRWIWQTPATERER
jgi:hypothetical protein